MLYVTKFDGSRQPFVKEKLINTCLRMNVSLEQAKAIAAEVEKEAFSGIATKQLFGMLLKHLKEYNPAIKHQIDLRTAISLLRPKPDFEQFIGAILKDMGYEIEMNKIVPGRCSEYEIDVIARNAEDTILVEVKHHVNPHEYLGVDVFLENNSVFEDVTDGYKNGVHNYKFNKLLIACNTKISDHSKKYSLCKGIQHIAWKSPKGNSLEGLIESKRLYPITMVKILDKRSQERLGNNGVILLKQLIDSDLDQLRQSTGVNKNKLKELVSVARKILFL